MLSPKVFLITGCSSGFGKALVQGALDTGHKVVAASRCPDILRFDGANKNNYIPVSLDLGSSPSVKAAFDEAARKFGRVDVVINNAGYGLAGAFEELTDDDVQSIMDVNFMGVVRVTRQAIQTMRDINNPPGGLIQQITSIGGQAGMAVVSAYCASKWAVEGLTESIAKEMRPEWNIKLMCIEPGGFRTEWANKNMVFRDPRQAIPAYDHLNAEKIMAGASRAQMGDPVKGAAAILQLAAVHNPPLRVPLGSEAFGVMEAKWRHGLETYREFENIALPVDLDAGDENGRVLSQL